MRDDVLWKHRQVGCYHLRTFRESLAQSHCRYALATGVESVKESYQQHLKTDHFQKYKQGTLHMVKDLKLPTMKPLDPETMKLIFKKQR